MEKQDRERASAPIAQERVRRSSKKKRRDVQRRTLGSASLPAPAERLGPNGLRHGDDPTGHARCLYQQKYIHVNDWPNLPETYKYKELCSKNIKTAASEYALRKVLCTP